jgi:signal transduction histidine kinase
VAPAAGLCHLQTIKVSSTAEKAAVPLLRRIAGAAALGTATSGTLASGLDLAGVPSPIPLGAALGFVGLGGALAVLRVGCPAPVRRAVAATLGLACGLSGVWAFSVRADAAAIPPDSALGLVLAGVAVFLIALPAKRAATIGQALVLPMIVVSWIALFGYAYTIRFPMGLARQPHMTIPNVLLFNVLGLAILGARPYDGLMAVVTSSELGGVLARRLLPACVILPILLGWVVLMGERGRLYNAKFGISLIAGATILMFASLTWLAARQLDRVSHERQRLARILLEEVERRHLARELHDEVGQQLTGLKLRLEALTGRDVADLPRLVADLLGRVRALSLDLRPPALDDLGLLPALRGLIERYRAQTQIEVDFEHETVENRLGIDLETAAFRIIQEALTNVARHGQTREVEVRVWREDGMLNLSVIDHGKGFDPQVLAKGGSRGLHGMRERALALGGRVSVESAAGKGVRVLARIPL